MTNLHHLILQSVNAIMKLKGGVCMKMSSNKGKKFDQKMKPFLVYEYLMRNSDENNVAK